MIQLTNTDAQNLTANQPIIFDKVSMKTGCGECYNSQVPTSVKLCGHGGVYEIHFSGNVAAPTPGTPVSLSLAIGGTPIPESQMVFTPAAATDIENVSTSILLKNCCCDLDRISVINSGGNPLTVGANANLYIVRKS